MITGWPFAHTCREVLGRLVWRKNRRTAWFRLLWSSTSCPFQYLTVQVYSGWYKEQFVAIKLLCNETDAKLTKAEYNEFIMEGKLMLYVNAAVIF